ncbi:hypothetical protein KAR91_73435 [Candidatus Pacearchaeota archaeon]|nr:hypothetical protein [Candidatus Pacearchaeota archaeon]
MGKKRLLLISSILVILMVTTNGCEEVFLGAAGSAAVVGTVSDWENKLETRKLELESEYNAIMVELDNAPDPNAVATIVARLNAVQELRLVNEGSLIATRAVLEIPEASKTGGGKTDVVVTAGISGLLLVLNELRRRTTVKKYQTMKIGKSRLAEDDPAAESKLTSIIRTVRDEIGVT